MGLIPISEEINKVPYLYDQSGRIWLKGERILRIIENKDQIIYYKELLNSPDIEELFSAGLIRTKIVEGISSEDALVLEHERIPFILHPCEYSNQMFWEAACMFIKLNILLFKKGFLTHDSHPWNISFNGDKPVFYDFGSIIKRESVSKEWFDEFFRDFIVPIWLANFSVRTYDFAKEYRREHGRGFGIKFFNSVKIRKIFFRNFRNLIKYKNNPDKLFKEILEWLHKHEPLKNNPEYWSDYYKSHSTDFKNPVSVKQKFVYQILSDEQPEKVVDLASNKGYYSFMAAHLGASVIAFDYEEEVINNLISNIKGKKITPAHMDFNKPTAGLGPGLFWENAFNRFNSNIVLALGLIHHICITQDVPVFLFCETCKKYAKEGIILEFVDPTDIHVLGWKKKTPKDYNLSKIKHYMSDQFINCKESQIEKNNGLNRVYLYFYN